MTRVRWLPAFAACFILMGGVCETDVLNDPAFQFWCGERLCEWDTLEGQIARVPTWHAHDYAVELIGDPVVLAQAFQGTVGGCALVELLADIEPEAMVSISIDQDGFGGPEWETVVEGTGFRRATRTVELDVDPGGFVQVRKDGPGRAVIAQLRITRGCADDDPN